jgi:hypothetical protein
MIQIITTSSPNFYNTFANLRNKIEACEQKISEYQDIIDSIAPNGDIAGKYFNIIHSIDAVDENRTQDIRGVEVNLERLRRNIVHPLAINDARKTLEINNLKTSNNILRHRITNLEQKMDTIIQYLRGDVP